VPQIQAFAIVAANRGRFGLDDLDPAPPFDFGEIAVPPDTPLRLVARAAGVSIGVLRDYNPGLLRDRTPPDGSDTLVSVPADRVTAALAAFPSLYARETEKLAAASASAAASAPAASASASASAKAPEPPSDRFTVAGGVVVERRAAEGPDASVSARVEIVGRGAPRPGDAFDVAPIAARPGELDAALGRAAQAVHALVTDGGGAAVEARRRAGDPIRQRLAKAPYGAAWLSLGDRLFGPGHPLEGTELVSPSLPLTSVAIAEPSPAHPGALLRITVTVAGAAPRAAVAEAAERAFAGVLEGHAAVEPYPREDRIDLDQAVPSTRVVFGWVAPSESEAERAALRLAILALAHNEVGKVAHALVADTHVAVHVRGFLDLGERAGVAAFEVVPAVLHTEADVVRETDAALAAFALTPVELAAVKAQLRARLQGEEARAGTAGEARDAALARLTRVRELSEAMSGEELSALVKRVFTPDHRVVVITRPRG
jgi:membrane-bound lytic murein transglycosylase D